MGKMSEERLEKYRALDRDFWDFRNAEAREFIQHAMEKGFRLSADPYGTRKFASFFQAPMMDDPAGADIAIIGIAMDLNAMGNGGTRHGPGAVRKRSQYNIGLMHERTEKIPLQQCSVIDFGDVEWSKTSLEERLLDIEGKFYAAAGAGAYTLGVGGEHTSTYAILKALSRANDDEAFGLIHIDAHADTMAAYEGDRVNDGSCMRYGVVDGVIDPERTVQIGIRNSYSKLIWDFSYESGMTVITADEVHDKGTRYVLDKIHDVVGADKAYFSFDSDGLCAADMMGTTNPELFGLTARQARDIILGCRGLDIVGADFMEHNPLNDPSGYSTLVASMMCFELLCLLADAREQHNGGPNPTTWE